MCVVQYVALYLLTLLTIKTAHSKCIIRLENQISLLKTCSRVTREFHVKLC